VLCRERSGFLARSVKGQFVRTLCKYARCNTLGMTIKGQGTFGSRIAFEDAVKIFEGPTLDGSMTVSTTRRRAGMPSG
jgi:hypothetical protein